MNGIKSKKRHGRDHLSFAGEGIARRQSTCKQGKEFLPDTRCTRVLNLDFPSSRTVRNDVYLSYLVYDFLL